MVYTIQLYRKLTLDDGVGDNVSNFSKSKGDGQA